MKLSKILFLLFLFTIFLFSKTVFASVTQIVFITTPQAVGVNTPSEIITVQLQNSSGALENSTETVDLVFTSTSPTGQFLSATTPGNPVVARINSGSANKNFLYQDSASGTHTIKVVATGRVSLSSASAEQQITVGVGDQVSTEETSTEESTSNTTSSENNSSPVVVSAHSSPAVLSNSEEKIAFEISAGRDRLTVVGNSLLFKATPTKFENIPESGITYYWSFGDGTVAQGNNAKHTYKFAGDYSVVVNANYSDKQAVSRMQVKVVSSDILISKISGGIEIYNRSKNEINLEGWSLESSRKKFVFPGDTLIPAGKKIIFPDDVTLMSDEDIRLISPIGREIGRIEKPNLINTGAQITNANNPNLDEIQTKINEIKSALAQIPKTEAFVQTTPTNFARESTLVATVQKAEVATETGETTTENTATVFEAEKRTGIVSRIFAWPIRGFNFLQRLFVEE